MATRSDVSPRQQALVAALASGLTKTEAAATLGLGQRTVQRYLNRPEVRLALKAAQDDTLAEVARKMNAGGLTALGVLEQVMGDKTMPPTVRVRAALGWLDVAFRAKELYDLAERIASLEERLGVNDATITGTD